VAAVRRTGHDFAAALVRGDGSAACGLLTPSARSSVGGATDAKCEEAILNLQEGGEDPGASQVWGDAAQVRVGDDVLFLRRIGGKWLVAAAGCEPQSTGPYECKVSA
jgi:hypothetical protein